MTQVQGVVEGYNCKDVPGKKGTMKKVGIKVNGEWHNIFSKEDFAGLEGAEVSFTEAENAKGFMDVDPKSVKIHKAAGAPAARASGGAGADTGSVRGPAGAAVGNALNNAILLITAKLVPVAEGQVLATVEKVARGILSLAAKLGNATASGRAETPAVAPTVPPPPPPPPPAPVAAPKPEPDFEEDGIPF